MSERGIVRDGYGGMDGLVRRSETVRGQKYDAIDDDERGNCCHDNGYCLLNH